MGPLNNLCFRIKYF